MHDVDARRQPSSPESSAAIPAPERAYEALKRQILSGELAGGAMTSENAVAAELGMSRTPVRTAFARLSDEGLLQVHPKRGAVVTPIGPSEAADVFDARLLVESHALEALCALPDADRSRIVDRLDALIAAQAAAIGADDAGDDLLEYSRQDTAFHLAIVEAAGNALLTSFFRSLRDRQQRLVAAGVRRAASQTEQARAFVHEHRTIRDAIGAADPSAARAALDQHLASAREVLA